MLVAGKPRRPGSNIDTDRVPNDPKTMRKERRETAPPRPSQLKSNLRTFPP